MSTTLSRALGTVGAAIVATLTLAVACARDGEAQVAATRAPTVTQDTTSLAWLLRAVRGADPLLCELAIRNVDMHGSWSHWGPLGDNPLEADSGAAEVIGWIQDRHDDPVMVPRLSAA